MKILITSGGTREYLDAVRFITNMSTGATGRAIAEYLGGRGHKVVCLCAEGAAKPTEKVKRRAFGSPLARGLKPRASTAAFSTPGKPGASAAVKIIEFTGFSSLNSKLRELLKTRTFDAVIHLAAISDYSPVSIKLGAKTLRPGRAVKINSAADTMTIVLKRNFKILDKIKKYTLTNKQPYTPLVIGFKLTAGASKTEILKRVKSLTCADYVVHNDLAEMRGGEKEHPFHIYQAGLKACDCANVAALAKKLECLIKGE